LKIEKLIGSDPDELKITVIGEKVTARKSSKHFRGQPANRKKWAAGILKQFSGKGLSRSLRENLGLIFILE